MPFCPNTPKSTARDHFPDVLDGFADFPRIPAFNCFLFSQKMHKRGQKLIGTCVRCQQPLSTAKRDDL